MKILMVFSLIILSSLCRVDDLSKTTQQEIEHLFTYLQASGCQFNRNGSWYSASEAVAHIRKKYEYLLSKKALTTTESFIEKTATQSSMSGRPYQVRCEGQAVILSSVWFNKVLYEYRQSK